LAERLANAGNKKGLIIDKRNHIAGNAYDFYDEHGILVHKYGPHIFHTNSKDVFEYLGNFTDWRPYEHHVLASVEGQLVPMPINLNTINELFGLNLSSSGFEELYRLIVSEVWLLSIADISLHNMFCKCYPIKQCRMEPAVLEASVTVLVPTRTNKDIRYFTDSSQAMPAGGYTRMFAKMLSHP